MARIFVLLLFLLQLDVAEATSCKVVLNKMMAIQGATYLKIKKIALKEYEHDIKISTGKVKSNAQENLKHVSRLAEQVEANRLQLENTGVDTLALNLAIYFSDIGKSDRASQFIVEHYRGVKGWNLNTKMKAFLRHEDYGILLLQKNHQAWGLTKLQTQKIIDAIANHNGPGILDSWFGARYFEEFGKHYDQPYSLEGIIHTFLDRVDQGSLYKVTDANGTHLAGGIRKIVYDETSRYPEKKFSDIVYDIFYNTPAYSEKQVLELRKLAAQKPEWLAFFETNFFKEKLTLIKNVSIIREMITFTNSKSGDVLVGEKTVSNPSDLFKALEEQIND